jgi:hypothetical protein
MVERRRRTYTEKLLWLSTPLVSKPLAASQQRAIAAPEDSRVVPIVVAPFELGYIQREIFAAGAGLYEPARRWLSRIWRGRLYPSPRGDAARKEAVAKLHEQGLSQRQIAAAAGAITSMVPMRNQGWLILA